MNPQSTQPSAETPQSPLQLHQVVTNQGILLGQHDKILRIPAESNQVIVNQVGMLINRIEELSAGNQQQSPAPASVVVPQPSSVSSSTGASQGPPIMHEPFLPTPERYGGDLPGVSYAGFPRF